MNSKSARFPMIPWWPCEGGSCVEVGPTGDGVAVRDSKDPDGPVLWFTSQEWVTFMTGAKAGRFDQLG
jgi:Domain of unknown function (DUF397)